MKVLKPKLNRYSILRLDRTNLFRSMEQFYGKNENLVFMNNRLANPLSRYELITVPIAGGTYQFKIYIKDKLGNINSGATISKLMSERLWQPKNVSIDSIDTNTVTLTWDAPSGGLEVTHYRVYGNGGSGYVIDRNTTLVTVPATLTTTPVIVADGKWMFVVESYNDDEDIETVNYFTQIATIPVEDEDPNNPNDPENPPINGLDKDYVLQNIHLGNVSVGKCSISFLWTYGTVASYFRIYTDNGTGTMDWNNMIGRFARVNSANQNFITNQLAFAEVQTFKIGIRAESANGVIEQNLIEYSVDLDGTPPDNAVNIIAEEL